MENREDIQKLIDQVLLRCGSQSAEVLLLATDSSLTRFANNTIHQNVHERDTTLHLRLLDGLRRGMASSNRLDPAGLDDLVARARLFTWPAAIAVAPDDVMYMADTQAHRIRRYDPKTGMVTTVAGTWTSEDEDREQPLVARNLVVLSGDAIGIGFSDDQGWLMPVCSDGLDMSMYLDDGKPALEARLYDVVGLTLNGKGDIIFVDKGSNRVRSIDHRYRCYLHSSRRAPVRL